jgi:glycerol-3-phosphate acyltransferase PlsY
MVTNILLILLTGLIGYLCGSIPPGWIYVRLFKGEDLRQVGSGRTGGTNSMRAAGLGVGILTSLSDVLKGAAGIWLSRGLLNLLGSPLDESMVPWALASAGVFAVIGHNWSLFLGFTGGAGTGPNVGWSSAIWWPMFPIAVITMPVTMVISGMASVGSMMMGLSIAVAFGIRYAVGADATPAYMVGGILTFLIVVWALRPNIRRIMNGTERLVGPRAWRKKRKEEEQQQREQALKAGQKS